MWFQIETWASLLTLTSMEVVLGIDNILVISILSEKLPAAERPKVRRTGLAIALVMRLGLLTVLSWLMSMTAPLFRVATLDFSLRHLVLLMGGVFLIAKATQEIFDKLEGGEASPHVRPSASFAAIVAQVALLDLVFSVDSVITAVGMAQQLPVMIAAMVLACGIMLVSAGVVGDFVNRHPSVTMLGLSFLLLIGVLLVAEGFGAHVQRGYLYFAMAFSLLVELLNMRLRKKHAPVGLHHPQAQKGDRE